MAIKAKAAQLGLFVVGALALTAAGWFLSYGSYRVGFLLLANSLFVFSLAASPDFVVTSPLAPRLLSRISRGLMALAGVPYLVSLFLSFK